MYAIASFKRTIILPKYLQLNNNYWKIENVHYLLTRLSADLETVSVDSFGLANKNVSV